MKAMGTGGIGKASGLGLFLAVALFWAVLSLGDNKTTAASQSPPTPPPGTFRFAIIGDYGFDAQPELDVANLVKSWNPELIITVGDNNYPDGAASTIDPNIGQYYQEFIYPYIGSYGQGAPYNKFFPSLGNHDWITAGAQPYLNYFTLYNNERYYDFTRGPVHFLAVDSDPAEPDGITAASTQGTWVRDHLAASTSPWKLVYMHHPPYSSGPSGQTPALQWPYAQWGASAVLTGHDHTYERIIRNNFPYFVNGLGGRDIHNFGTPIPGSIVRYNSNYGAMLVDATSARITFQFWSRGGNLIDTYSIDAPVPKETPTPTCCLFTGTIQTTCSYDAGTGFYDFSYTADIENPCGMPVSTSYNFYLEASVDGGNFNFVARTSIENRTFQPGHNIITGGFQGQSIQPEYLYYRIRMQIYNCGIYSIYSSTAALCGPLGTQTATAQAATATPTRTSTQSIPTSTTASPTPTRTSTPPNTPSPSPSGQPTETYVATNTHTHTPLPTDTPLPPPTTCPIQFTDVPTTHTFYAAVRCLACQGIVSGYADGTFRPNNQVTRGQLAKMVSNSAGFSEPVSGQIFQDVPPSHTFYEFIERLTSRGHMTGYVCGGPGEPCVNNQPYFRSGANATRGQTSKIVANAAGFNEPPVGRTFEDVSPTHTFYAEIQRLASRNVMQGYACGGPFEPCVSPDKKPYFRPGNDVTRGQSAKIVANAFFAQCNQ